MQTKNHGSTWRRMTAAALALVMVLSVLPAVSAADSVLPDDHRGLKSAQPDLKGYRIQEILTWDPATDPFADYLKASVPLQERNELFQPTQADPVLDGKAQVMLMQGDYGNAFFESPLYNNDFSNLCMNFWQYTDYFCPWHGAVPYDTPESFYDSPKDSWWTRRGFEFGIVNLPTAAYTNAAHKNGAKSIACIYFDPTGRPGQTCSDMFQRDAENGFPVAQKMIEIANYYGFDGYFFNNEENSDQSFKDFMQVIRDAGLYVQYYNTGNSFSGKKEWMGTPTNRYCDSVFVNYGWPSTYNMDSDKAEFAKGTWDPYETAFYGVESNQGHLNGNHPSERNVPMLYRDQETDHNPIGSVALFTPSDYYHRGLTDNLGWDGPWDGESPNQNPEYQWMIAERERMYFSGALEDPTRTGKMVVSRPDIALPQAGGFVGVADFISERSVIGGSTFYSNFNTGHGMQYFVDGAVSADEEWTNMNLQDILPTWQWWIDTTGQKKLSADFDYGVKETRRDSSMQPMTVPYTQVGAYDGGSSLVLYGELDGRNTMHLFKTDLAVNDNSQLAVTFQKVAGESPVSIGLVMKDAPDVVEEIALPSSASVGGWVTDTLSLADYAGRQIAAIYVIAEGTDAQFQLNLGAVRVLDGQDHTPAAPTGLTLKNVFSDGQIELRWNLADYDAVRQYNVYIVDAEGSRSFAGGLYGDAFYVKNAPVTGEITVELTAVGPDGSESEAASVSYNFDNAVSGISVPQAMQVNPNNEKSAQSGNAEAGVVDAHWTAPVNADVDHYELTVTLLNYGNAYQGDKVYTATAPADATSFKVPVPVLERYDYLLQIVSVAADGTRGQPICFQGKLKDTYAAPMTPDDVYISSGTVYAKTPRLMDWYRVHLSVNGEEMSYRQRATNAARQGWQVQDGDMLSFTMEDYVGNVSEPLALLVSNGKLEVPTGLLDKTAFPDAALLSAVKTQVGLTRDAAAEYVGGLDLTGLLVTDLTGLDLIPGLTSIKFNNNTALTALKPSDFEGLENLKTIEITGCTGLTSIDLSGLGLEHFIASGDYAALTYANISDNCFDLSEGTPERESLEVLMQFTGTEAPAEAKLALDGATLLYATGFKNNDNAAVIFDGNVKTREDCGGYSAHTVYVKFKLPEARTITVWEPYSGHNDKGKAFGSKSAVLSVSYDEGETWEEVDRITGMDASNPDAAAEAAVAFPRTLETPVTAQYFKYEITEFYHDWMAAWDVMLYEGNATGGILFGNQHPAAYSPVALLDGQTVNLPKAEGTKDLNDYTQPLVSLHNNTFLELGDVRINGLAFTAEDYAAQLPTFEWTIASSAEGAVYGDVIDTDADRTYTVTFTDAATQELVSTLTVIVGEGSKIPENLLLDEDGSKGYIIGATNMGKESPSEAVTKINDGSLNTKWCPGGSFKESWLAVDLKGNKALTKWVMVNAGGGFVGDTATRNTVDYDLEVLDTSKITVEDLLALEGEALQEKLADDSIWTVVASHRDNTANKTEDEFVPAIQGQIFRLHVLNGDNSRNYASTRIVELELHGYASAGPVDPDPIDPDPTDPVEPDDLAALKEAAEAAQSAAEEAQRAAAEAQARAEEAQAAAEEAAASSAADKTAAEAAQAKAVEAKAQAEEALSAAETAQAAAEEAAAAAEASNLAAAEDARKAAETAAQTAKDAAAAAESARQAAAAQAAAQQAQQAAEEAAAVAEQARKDAEEARRAAEDAASSSAEDREAAENALKEAAAAEEAAEAARKAAEDAAAAAETAAAAAEASNEAAARSAAQAADSAKAAAEAYQEICEMKSQMVEYLHDAQKAREEAEAARKAAEAAELACARFYALHTLSEYVDLDNYRATEQKLVSAAIDDAVTAINDAETAAEVDAILAQAKVDLDAIPTAAEQYLPFTDVKEGDWYEDAVRYVYHRDLFNGVSQTAFAPNNEMTRAQLITALYRLAGEEPVEGESVFEDVASDAYYAKAVIWGTREGIVSGVTETRFDPNAPVTRAQAAAFLYRMSGEKVEEDHLADFADAQQIPAYAVEAMNWAAARGILNGAGEDGSLILAAHRNVRRAEAAAMIMRFDLAA